MTGYQALTCNHWRGRHHALLTSACTRLQAVPGLCEHELSNRNLRRITKFGLWGDGAHGLRLDDAGVDDEFVFVGRLDNLAMSFCSLQVCLLGLKCDACRNAFRWRDAPYDILPVTHVPACAQRAVTCRNGRASGVRTDVICSPVLNPVKRAQALIDGCGDDALEHEAAVKAVALFDHEECGSSSAQGALLAGSLEVSEMCLSSCSSCGPMFSCHVWLIFTRIA